MIKRLPQFAEHYFASLCASAGVVCNSSDQDECGWDFFLQFPNAPSHRMPLDMQPPGPEALVQVKSTRTYPTNARMKLSNALRMAQASQPCFVVLVLDDQKRLRVFVKHFWKDEIKRTLKRVRESEATGYPKLNKRILEIRMLETDCYDNPLEWIRQQIAGVKPSYVTEKSEFVAATGFENGFGSVNLTIGGGTEDFLNLQLGLVESLPLSQAKYFSERFGIVATIPEFDLSEGELFVTPEPKPVRLRLQAGSPTQEIFVDANLYTANLPGKLENHFRWRLDAGPLRLVGGKGHSEVDITIKPDEPRSLGDLKTFLTIAGWSDAGPIGIHVYVEGEVIPLGVHEITKPARPAQSQDLLVWVNALDLISKAAGSFEPEFSIAELDSAEPWISRFAGLTASQSFKLEFTPITENSQLRALIYYVRCDVAQTSFLAVIERYVTSDEMEGDKRHISFGPPKILDAFLRRGGWRDHEREIKAAFQAQVERLGYAESLLEIGDIEDFIHSSSG